MERQKARENLGGVRAEKGREETAELTTSKG